jgi:hypothetical protein
LIGWNRGSRVVLWRSRRQRLSRLEQGISGGDQQNAQKSHETLPYADAEFRSMRCCSHDFFTPF